MGREESFDRRDERRGDHILFRRGGVINGGGGGVGIPRNTTFARIPTSYWMRFVTYQPCAAPAPAASWCAAASGGGPLTTALDEVPGVRFFAKSYNMSVRALAAGGIASRTTAAYSFTASTGVTVALANGTLLSGTVEADGSWSNCASQAIGDNLDAVDAFGMLIRYRIPPVYVKRTTVRGVPARHFAFKLFWTAALDNGTAAFPIGTEVLRVDYFDSSATQLPLRLVSNWPGLVATDPASALVDPRGIITEYTSITDIEAFVPGVPAERDLEWTGPAGAPETPQP